MFVLIATLFTLFYYSTLLKLPIVIGSLQTILFIDIITSFLYFWIILNKRNTMIQKAVIVFLCGLASDVFLLNSIYFNSIFYLLLLIFIDQNDQVKTDRLLRVLYFIGFNFVMILVKSLILSSLGKVSFFQYFLTNAILQLPISTVIGFIIILPLVRLMLFLAEKPKKRYIKL
ncbi:MAG: hypothetical protein ACRCV7_02080 [Culicoidibacterales bacterium]